MMTTPNQQLLEWVRKLRTDLTPDGSISRLELFHSVEGEMGERLATIEMADRDEDEDPDDLAQEVWNEAEEDSSTRPQGSYQRYVIQAFRGDTREPDEQKSFTTRGKLITALTGASTEPPTPRGQLAQSMREHGDMHALMIRLCEHTAGSAAQQLDRERSENQRLREVGFQYEKLRQDALDRQAERDVKLEEAKAQAQQMQMLMGVLLQFAPVVLNKLLSAPAPPGAAQPLPPPTPSHQPSAAQATAPAIVPALGTLLSTVNPEQMQALLGIFDEKQVQQFLSIYQAVRDTSQTPPPASPASEPPRRPTAN